MSHLHSFDLWLHHPLPVHNSILNYDYEAINHDDTAELNPNLIVLAIAPVLPSQSLSLSLSPSPSPSASPPSASPLTSASASALSLSLSSLVHDHRHCHRRRRHDDDDDDDDDHDHDHDHRHRLPNHHYISQALSLWPVSINHHLEPS